MKKPDIKLVEKRYLQDQQEKIMSFATEAYNQALISHQQLCDTYYEQNMKTY